MDKTSFKKLAQHLDKLPDGFSTNDSDVDLRLLQRLFTEEEADHPAVQHIQNIFRENPEKLMTVLHTAHTQGWDPAEFLKKVLDTISENPNADISKLLKTDPNGMFDQQVA